MIGIYNYTVILTYLGTLSGFTGILCITSGNVKSALLCLMAAGFCDMFDGKIAATMERTRQEKRLGIQIDSLSDLICFGVLPGMIGYHCSGKTPLSAAIAAGYVLCALIRLAWFNVDEEQRQDEETSRRALYLGLPVTTSALLLPLFIGAGWRNGMAFAEMTHWLLLGIGIAFLTPFHLKKPEKVGVLLLALMGLAAFVTVLTGVTA